MGPSSNGDLAVSATPRRRATRGSVRRLRETRHLAASLVTVVLAATAAAALPPSTRWSITRRHGVDWLVTPEGTLFFSIGVNTIDGGGPEPTAYAWSRVAPDYRTWLEATRARVLRWGFNTAGATSVEPDELGLPVVPDLELGRTARFHWLDPFHPATAARMRAAAPRLVRPYVGRPARIGYFSDNEVGWWNGALFAYYLERPPTNHTKRRLVRLLRSHYADDWSRLARDFTPPAGVHSFASLLRGRGTLTLRPAGRGMRVVQRWTRAVARRYYVLVHRALRAADPDALVFGDRLPIYYDPAAVRAMAPWVDAIATNYNVDSPDGWIARYYFDGLRTLTGGKPVLVSEWFFAARENRSDNRNNGHLMTVATQAERARGAAAAARRFAAEPTVVGLHWFQYYDHPTGGREDGEDYDFGLVDVDDRPYEELVGALGDANAALATLHAEGRPASEGARTAIPAAAIDLTDRSLADWPKEAALVPDVTAPAPDVPFGD